MSWFKIGVHIDDFQFISNPNFTFELKYPIAYSMFPSRQLIGMSTTLSKPKLSVFSPQPCSWVFFS